MSKRKFLLAAPKTFDLYKLIVKNLEYLGYDVVHIEDSGYPFRYKSLRQRLYNFFRKTFFGDKGYKSKLRTQHLYESQLEILHQAGNMDIALVIRADFFDKRLMEAIRHKSELMLCFHFDGIDRDPVILDYVRFFDRFYVFDPNDITKYPSSNLRFSPNFYFDYPEVEERNAVVDRPNVFYVSTYHPSRVEALIDLHKYLVGYYDRVQFIVVCPRETVPLLPDYVTECMDIRHDYLLFEEQLRYIAVADVIIDLVLADHNGYSFRILEGLKYGKKVITTNKTVQEADFYHENNFFILQDDNYGALDDFLRQPYVPIADEIVEKYSFSSWLSDKLVDK